MAKMTKRRLQVTPLDPPERTLRELAQEIEDALRAAGTEERAVNEKRYLKSELEHFGVPVPMIRRVTKAAVRDPSPENALTIPVPIEMACVEAVAA